MRIKLKTLKYYGEQTEVHDHDMYGKVFLFPKGTKRDIQVLLLPSFKTVVMTQEATIEEGRTPTDGILYAHNGWIYEEDTLRRRIMRASVVYLNNKIVKNRYGKEESTPTSDELFGAEIEIWDEKTKVLFLKSK
jgi:hypothetical protein